MNPKSSWLYTTDYKTRVGRFWTQEHDEQVIAEAVLAGLVLKPDEFFEQYGALSTNEWPTNILVRATFGFVRWGRRI